MKRECSRINEKNLLEVFSIKKLWNEAFNQILKNEDQIIFATNQFKPDNIVVGQGWISARSRDDAIEWLKVIKTALIFIDPETKSEDFTQEIHEEPPEEEDRLDNRFKNIFD